ncbi:hypothetical protein [Leptospira stimsonii]|uniref:SH3b domain-containing protein n=1 Tax=Leptospira stimsonii TaxID=2202203 RepID=A0ABY2N5B4_9LEPT|nr:hypothetical protein [Leptospira stimsonii]TGK26944.1 hypothetical protein EHO98_00005 [Leptospira stimsonii]TGM16908.1 hypothetical protein EHQ90_08380 [Leptospira stimsonii]
MSAPAKVIYFISILFATYLSIANNIFSLDNTTINTKQVFYLPPSIYTIRLFNELNNNKDLKIPISATCIEYDLFNKYANISFPWIKRKFRLEILPISKDTTRIKIDLTKNKTPLAVSIFDNGDVSVGLYQISSYGVERFSIFKEGIKFNGDFEACSAPPIEVYEGCKVETNEKFAYITAISGLRLREKPNSNAKALALIPYNEKINFDSADIVYPIDPEGNSSSWLNYKWKEYSGYIPMDFLSNSPICYPESAKLQELHDILTKKSVVIYQTKGIALFNELTINGISQRCEFNMDGYGSCTVKSYVVKDNSVIFEIESSNKDIIPGIWQCEVSHEEFFRYSPFRTNFITPRFCNNK